MGEYLTARRKKLGLTQSQVASLLGYTPQLISMWENGKVHPDLSVWGEYAKLLNVDISSFLNENDFEPYPVGKVFDSVKFASNLKSLRLEKKLRQLDLGKLIGVNNKTISNWEHGISTPNKEQFILLAKTYAISYEELYFGAKMETSIAIENPIITDFFPKNAAKPRYKARLFKFLLAFSCAVLLMFSFIPLSSNSMIPNDSTDVMEIEPEVSESVPTMRKQVESIKKVDSLPGKDEYEIVYSNQSKAYFWLDLYTGLISSESEIGNISQKDGYFLLDGEESKFPIDSLFFNEFRAVQVLFINNNVNLLTFGIAYSNKPAIVDFFKLDYKGIGDYQIYSNHDVYFSEEGYCVVDGWTTGSDIDLNLYFPSEVHLGMVEKIDYLHTAGNIDYYDIVMKSGFEVWFTYDPRTKDISIANPILAGKISLSVEDGRWNLNGFATSFNVHSSKQDYQKTLYTVSWVDFDGTFITDELFEEGAMPISPDTTYFGYSDDGVHYGFSYWSPSIQPVKENTTYIANYEGNLDNGSYSFHKDSDTGLTLIDGFSLSGFEGGILYLPINIEGVMIDGISFVPSEIPDGLKIYVPRTYSFVAQNLLLYLL